jgi:hypothetical protein
VNVVAATGGADFDAAVDFLDVRADDVHADTPA